MPNSSSVPRRIGWWQFLAIHVSDGGGDALGAVVAALSASPTAPDAASDERRAVSPQASPSRAGRSAARPHYSARRRHAGNEGQDDLAQQQYDKNDDRKERGPKNERPRQGHVWTRLRCALLGPGLVKPITGTGWRAAPEPKHRRYWRRTVQVSHPVGGIRFGVPVDHYDATSHA
jgi:hypothetical protein